MLTTIQLEQKVKMQLFQFKQDAKETYQDVILRLMNIAKNQDSKNEELLVMGYTEMAAHSKEINDEWKTADLTWD